MTIGLMTRARKRLKQFAASMEGAVTIDWVVLTALVVALAAAALGGVEGGAAALTQKIADYLNSLLV